MSGHMVSVRHEGDKHVYMANVADRDEAIAQVERMSGLSGGEAMTPIEAATLDHYGVELGQVRQFLTLNHEGEVSYSAD